MPYSVPNDPANLNPATDGLRNIAGRVNPDGAVTIWAVTSTVSSNVDQGADPNLLVTVTDTLAFTTAAQAAGEQFRILRAANYGEVLRGVSLTPGSGKIAPVISWTAPPAITFGSALSGVQLNATASVPGTFVYNPPAGTVLPVGNNQTLSVTFTPTDTVDYKAVTASTTINVNPASPPASPANLVITRVLTRTGGNVVVQLTIANTGGTAAANVTLANAKVGADTATPLPQNIGTIGPGSSAQATVTVPGSVGASVAASSLALSGTYTGGTFSSSARITLP